jgi:hypothetical protein
MARLNILTRLFKQGEASLLTEYLARFPISITSEGDPGFLHQARIIEGLPERAPVDPVFWHRNAIHDVQKLAERLSREPAANLIPLFFDLQPLLRMKPRVMQTVEQRIQDLLPEIRLGRLVDEGPNQRAREFRGSTLKPDHTIIVGPPISRLDKCGRFFSLQALAQLRHPAPRSFRRKARGQHVSG